MKTIPIGALRHRLVIEEPQRAPDGGGGASITWTEVATVWAGIRPVHGREQVVGERVSGEITHEVRLRTRPDIAPAMRLRLGQRIFEIVAVRDIDERQRIMMCLCREELL